MSHGILEGSREIHYDESLVKLLECQCYKYWNDHCNLYQMNEMKN